MALSFISLQLQGPTPKVPGLAMNKFPNSFLFLNEAKRYGINYEK